MAGLDVLGNLFGLSGPLGAGGAPVAPATGFDPSQAPAPPLAITPQQALTQAGQPFGQVLASLRAPMPGTGQTPQGTPQMQDVGPVDALAGAGGLPSVKGLDKGSAFFTGLSSGIKEAREAAAQRQAFNMQQMQMLWARDRARDEFDFQKSRAAASDAQAIRAASVRFMPSSTAASDKSRRLWFAFPDAAASRRSAADEKSFRKLTADGMARISPRHRII